jgi:hypothetical protein
LLQKTWDFATWQERYLNHPLVGCLARRLIWQFSQDERLTTGIWHAGQLVNQRGEVITWLEDNTQVNLWHPITDSTVSVLAWREWFDQQQLQQPFKQAHREIYLLTPAELNTRNYSNRFAAHIIKQHQFNALCSARAWKNKLRLHVDDSYTPAMRYLPLWNLRAEFWIEGIGEYGTDTTEAGTYLYLTTDQVRFYPIQAGENYAHACGGGYSRQDSTEPLALDTIPALVFSEIMRDVDLFIGVASVGNDPTWADGRSENRYQDYWHSYSFGDLSETAKTRKQLLEKLIPRLAIAPRCSFLLDRFLRVEDCKCLQAMPRRGCKNIELTLYQSSINQAFSPYLASHFGPIPWHEKP